MNDPTKLKELINTSKEGYIELDEDISYELLVMLARLKRKEATSLFKKIKPEHRKNGVSHEHTTYVKCPYCGKERIFGVYKLQELWVLVNDIKYRIRKFPCDFCTAELKRNAEDKKNKELKRKCRDTKEFINSYINKNKVWDNKIKHFKRLDEVKQKIKSTDIESIAEYICNMNYQDFLETPYWKAIAAYKRYKSKYKCGLCNSKNRLSVHHKTYERHGYEHLYWDEDLICLCDRCHKKFHNIKED